jgi:hypothetical protein
MSLIDTDFPEDADVVLAEVIAQLVDVDHRRVSDATDLAQAWREIRHCDGAVLEVFTPEDRAAYEAIIDDDHDDSGHGRDSITATSRMSAARLHVAIHRRVVLLHDLATHEPWLR